MAHEANAACRCVHFFDVFKCELALFRKEPLLIAAAVILILVPSFYTGTYVCSVWDPYGNLTNLPAGLVMLDDGVEFHGKSYNLGSDLVNKLNEEKPFKFLTFSSEEESTAAVRSGDIYFSLVVPADFSDKALPGIDAGKLKFYTSSGRSYVGMEMAKAMARQVADEVNAKIETERWKAVLASEKKGRDGAIKLRDGSEKALSGARELEEGLGKIDTKRLVSAGKELHDNTTKLAGGLGDKMILDMLIGVKGADLEKLAEGAKEYQEKIVELGGGLERLQAGSEVLTEGLGEIHKGLTEFAASFPVEKEKAESLAVSVVSEQIDLVPAPVNGAAFAPYFMGVSLWVGVLAVGFLFRSIVFPKSVADKPRIAKIIGKWMTPFLISSTAAVTLGLFIHFVLKVPIADEVGYYAILITAVFSFNAIILSLNSLIGDAGKLVSLLFLVVQISAVGGAFPLATQPHFYRAISPYLPMTNVVFGLRAAMFGSFDGNWLIHIYCMLPWLCISMALGLLASRRFNYVDDDKYGPALDMSFMKHNK